jgi:hypothetical protein
MRTTLLSLGLGLCLATSAFAASGGATKPVAVKKVAHHKIAEGDKPADGAKAETKKAPKKTTKKTEKKGEEKPMEAAPAK